MSATRRSRAVSVWAPAKDCAFALDAHQVGRVGFPMSSVPLALRRRVTRSPRAPPGLGVCLCSSPELSASSCRKLVTPTSESPHRKRVIDERERPVALERLEPRSERLRPSRLRAGFDRRRRGSARRRGVLRSVAVHRGSLGMFGRSVLGIRDPALDEALGQVAAGLHQKRARPIAMSATFSPSTSSVAQPPSRPLVCPRL